MVPTQPTITANLLAEYCYASAPRRMRIIEQMKDDEFEPFKKWYGEVPGAYRQYVASCLDDTKLTSLEAVLVKREAATDSEEEKILKQLDALEHIRQIDHARLFEAASIHPYNHPTRSLNIAGVSVRVNPTNLVVGSRVGHATRFVGVIKPYLKATRALPKEEALTLASLLHWFADLELAAIGTGHYGFCWVADIFAETLFQAPKAFGRRRALIEANCVEIAERWTAFGTAETTKRKREKAKAE